MKKQTITIAALLIATALSAQVTITIDKTKQYQKIEGFGGLLQESYDWGPSTTISDKFADDMVNDLGCTIFRHIIDGGFEPVNENSDPNNTDLSKFNMGSESGCKSNAHMTLNTMIPTLKKVRNLIEKNGEKAMFYTTVFSPPAWMKYIDCVSATDGIWNRLVTDEEELAKGGTNGAGDRGGPKDYKNEFAEFCYAYLQTMKNNGVVIDAFSIQNELVFPQPYSSCVYSPESYLATFRTTGKYLRDKGFNTRMMFTEDIGDLGRYNSYIKPITRDAVASKFADIAAIHSYSANAVSPGSTDASLWTSLDKVSRQMNANRAFWQTETSGYTNDYAGAISISTAIFTGLKYGKLNAWMFHGLSHPTEIEGLVLKGAVKTDRYYACKHYFKYIRPGSINVDITTSDESLLSLAFQNNEKKTLTVVLTNVGNAEKTISLKTIQGTGVPTSYKMYMTKNSNTRCADQGNVTASSSIKMPANSIVTLVGENSLPETPLANEEGDIATSYLEIYPNPSNGGFTIKANELNTRALQLELLNPQGIVVKSINMSVSETEKFIATEDLTAGVYFLKSDNKFTKVVIQK